MNIISSRATNVLIHSASHTAGNTYSIENQLVASIIVLGVGFCAITAFVIVINARRWCACARRCPCSVCKLVDLDVEAGLGDGSIRCDDDKYRIPPPPYFIAVDMPTPQHDNIVLRNDVILAQSDERDVIVVTEHECDTPLQNDITITGGDLQITVTTQDTVTINATSQNTLFHVTGESPPREAHVNVAYETDAPTSRPPMYVTSRELTLDPNQLPSYDEALLIMHTPNVHCDVTEQNNPASRTLVM